MCVCVCVFGLNVVCTIVQSYHGGVWFQSRRGHCTYCATEVGVTLSSIFPSFIGQQEARWPSGRASDSGVRGRGFDPHSGRRVVLTAWDPIRDRQR